MAIEPLILTIIRLASLAWDVPAPLIAAIIDVESSWNVHAVGDHNDKGEPQAFGLMQLHIKGAGHGYPPEFLLNPVFNILLGCRYLKYLESIYPTISNSKSQAITKAQPEPLRGDGVIMRAT